MLSTHKQVVEAANDAFATNSIEGFLSQCTDDVTWTMVGDRTVVGKDAVRQWLKSMNTEAPNFTVDHVIAEGDYVTQQGEMTMKEGGKAVPYAFCDVYRFRGDKIAELKAFVIKTDTRAATH